MMYNTFGGPPLRLALDPLFWLRNYGKGQALDRFGLQ